MSPTEVEQMIEQYVDRCYSTSYETHGFYVLSQSEMDDLIELVVSLVT